MWFPKDAEQPPPMPDRQSEVLKMFRAEQAQVQQELIPVLRQKAVQSLPLQYHRPKVPELPLSSQQQHTTALTVRTQHITGAQAAAQQPAGHLPPPLPGRAEVHTVPRQEAAAEAAELSAAAEVHPHQATVHLQAQEVHVLHLRHHHHQAEEDNRRCPKHIILIKSI